MQKTLFIKLSMIAGLCLLFTMALIMFSSVIAERQSYADSVTRDIAKQNVNPQQVITPFVVVPTTVTPVCNPAVLTQKDKCPEAYTQVKTLLAQQTVAKQHLAVRTDKYQLGIYHVTSYNGDLDFQQRYQIADIGTALATSNDLPNQALVAKEVVHWQQARLIIPVSDLRGVATLPTVTIDQQKTKATYPQLPLLTGLSYVEVALPPSVINRLQKRASIQQPQGLNSTAQAQTPFIATTAQTARGTDTGIDTGLDNATAVAKANLGASDASNTALTPSTLSQDAAAIAIDIHLPLTGIASLSTVPTGNNFEMSMSSNWHAPNFVIGATLPNDKTITNNGFVAKWQNQYLTIANNQNLQQCLNVKNGQCRLLNEPLLDADSYDINAVDAAVDVAADNTNAQLDSVRFSSFGVSFAEPNNVYLQTERAMKYALLLVLVSFGTFFLFEIIKASRIHPIQYLLVGSALLVFYVLLLPLAEQIAFWKAYAIAATACVGLIGWYSYYVLGSVKRAAMFSAILSGLYAAFYGILTTEDLNLLLGAVFCFVLLASVMVMTRKIDWYKVA